MKISTLALLTTASLGLATSASAGTLALVADIPTTDVLLGTGFELPQGSANNQQSFAFRPADAGITPNQGRGQSFILDLDDPAGSYAIDSISVSLGTSADDSVVGRPAGTLKVTIFNYGSATNDPEDLAADYQSGDGVQDGDLLDGTGQTAIFEQSFVIAADTAFASTDVLEVSFGAGELTLDEDIAYGIFYTYTLDDLTGLTEDVSIGFDVRQDAGINGFLLNAGTANGQSTSRDMNIHVVGTAVPEPGSLALLGLGGLLIARRRRA